MTKKLSADFSGEFSGGSVSRPTENFGKGKDRALRFIATIICFAIRCRFRLNRSLTLPLPKVGYHEYFRLLHQFRNVFTLLALVAMSPLIIVAFGESTDHPQWAKRFRPVLICEVG